MNERLVELLGVEVPSGAKARFEWGSLPRGESGLMMLLALGLLAALIVQLYRREGTASLLRKGLLAALRLVAVAVVALVLLEPRLAIDKEQTIEGHTLVLWDASLSMSLRDRYQDEARRNALAAAAGVADPRDLEGLTRHEVARKVVDRAALLPGLAKSNKTLVYAFDAEARELPGAATTGLPADLQPKGPATDLAGALRKALEDLSGRPLAAVVIVTDGKVNRGEGAQGIAAALRRDPPVKVFLLGIGDPTPPKNLEVVSLAVEPRVILGDPIVLQAALRARGYPGRTVTVVLTKAPRDGGPRVDLERRDVKLPEADGEPVEVQFTHRPEAVGDFVFEVSTPEQEEEPRKDDNRKGPMPVKVSDDQAKALLIAGSPTFEYHFLKTRLIRERTTVVSCWLQSAAPRFPQEGDERVAAMPASLEELKDYDAVILLDPDPDGFDAGVAEALKNFVANHKGGLLYAPGPKFTSGLFARADLKPLRDLMPVLPGEVEGRPATEAFPLRATVDGADHPATRLDPDPERCRHAWSRLPGPFSVWPIAHAKAGATPLVRHEDPSSTGDGGRPLLVAHYFDGGPVLWLGSLETWRWRSVAPKVYDRFWVGVMRFLVQGRLAGGRKRVELLTDKEAYTLGEPIRLRAHALDKGYQALQAAKLVARARVGADEVEVTLEKTSQAGWYEATFLPQAQGVVEVSVPLPDDEPGARPESISVPVRLPDIEFQEPILDEVLLSSVAAQTSGVVLKPQEVARVPEQVPSLSQKLTVAGAPILLWDRWETIALVVTLLAIEWTIRKRSRMV